MFKRCEEQPGLNLALASNPALARTLAPMLDSTLTLALAQP